MASTVGAGLAADAADQRRRSNDRRFKQHIGATDALRTGAYSKTLTFTLSTTTSVACAFGRRPLLGCGATGTLVVVSEDGAAAPRNAAPLPWGTARPSGPTCS